MKRASETVEEGLAELHGLEKEQQEALQDSIYLRPSEEQAREFDERRTRIMEMSNRLRKATNPEAA
jgi:hypothetical protein